MFKSTMEQIGKIGKKLAILLINTYRYFLSPFLGNNCRFHPSCSCYAKEAIERFGLLRGGWLSIKRILKCNPWNPGGYDPVIPEHNNQKKF